ncbi:MAG: Flagellar biosynthetic protein FliQ [Candidatus Anoxychlamydiales bacterium]|uniref:EscS/YscS/HrcS family type III secretion system export apparatus protein n=1 Tax=marine sediment metagenome TaxID=412755 RepID=A0A0F9JU89_9ZZZZ|nr:Flagellar biosynthetic protein FliQ [Candidatus Anoxychlamydiales bacterium]NGX40732.1 Flagellar biosynthetic protein FliQ [Candidatus Anoxychlamydiales bacterium]HEU64091.1 EscS/YscS/HrcS family type III secretion system export apparatus protein [Chlamydiota bacterium]
MFQNEIYQLTYQALILILILSGPPIIISMILGLLVAIFQAATQIQEQTLSFTVKLFAVIVTLMLLGGWLSAQIIQYANTIFKNFPAWNP